jgi:hypothetical protein
MLRRRTQGVRAQHERKSHMVTAYTVRPEGLEACPERGPLGSDVEGGEWLVWATTRNHQP